MIPLLLLGCAFGPGHGFGEIAAADLAVGFEPGEARDLGDGWVLANNGDRFTLDTLAFTVESLDLLALEGGGSATFDPANPPEGYGLCHGGHCHADDGRLVAYADIEAELAGDAAAFVAVVSWPLPESVADGFATALDPVRALPATTLSKVQLRATSVRLAGTYQAGEEALAFDGSIDLTGVELAGPLDLPFGRGEDPSVTLDVALLVDGTLFDDLDPTPWLGTGALPFDAPVTELLLDRLDGVEPVATTTRSPWSTE